MDLASPTQRHLTMRGFGSTHNGSQPPYHPSNGKEFSSTKDKFPSMGMVVAGDAHRAAASRGKSKPVQDSGLDYENLSGPAQHVLRHYSLSQTGIGLGLTTGLLLVYAGLDFPFAKESIRALKNIKLDRAFRTAALVGGGVLVAQNVGA